MFEKTLTAVPQLPEQRAYQTEPDIAVPPQTPLQALAESAVAFAGAVRMTPLERSAFIHQLNPATVPEVPEDLPGALEKTGAAYEACLDSGTQFSTLETEALRWFLARNVLPEQQPLPAVFIGQRLGVGMYRERTDVPSVFTGILQKLHGEAERAGQPPLTVSEQAQEKAYSYLAGGFEEDKVPTLSKEAGQLAVSHLSLVGNVVAGMGIAPWYEEHAHANGVLGLLDAAARFDSAKGTDFEDFAWPRIAGAITDGYRHQYRFNKRTKEIEEPALRTDTVRIDGQFEDSRETIGDILPDPRGSAETVVLALEDRKQRQAEVARLLSVLSPVERTVVIERSEGKLLKEIGRHIGVGETRALQLHKKALATLRNHLFEAEAV